MRKNPLNAFITKQLLALRALKQSYFSIFQLSKKPEDKIKYNQCRNEYNRKVRRAKKLYYSKLINPQKHHPKKMWETLKNITGLGNCSHHNSTNIEYFFSTDPIEVMEELEKLQNKSSQDIDGISGKLLKNISTEIAPPLSYIFN